jgi:serine protease Do
VLHLGDSDQVRVGDVCLAVGNPLGVGQSVTSGIISAKGRETDVGTGSFQNFLQTDAPINQGNSGGALVNTRAELIGINSQIISSNGGNVGIGFAIPSNMAKGVMNQLISSGKVQRGMLGVGIQTVTSDVAASLGLKQVGGVLVNSVNPGGPADRAGVQTGDLIVKLNGRDVSDANDLRNAVAATPPGTEVTLTILRNGSQQDLRLKLGELTASASSAGPESEESGGSLKLGMTVAPLTPDLAAQAGVPRGTHGVVVEAIDPNGPAAEAGIQAGDVIQQVNGQRVTSTADVQTALAKSGNRPPLLLINRGGQTVFVPVPLG